MSLWACAWLLPGPASAQAIGHEGPSYAGADPFPSGNKPQSKLWYADGRWWGCLWSASAQSFVIHGLDASTQTWTETVAAVDSRPDSHADCLWDGAKLYIASHRFTHGAGASGHPVRLYRYSYDPNADVYSLDTAFPVEIADNSTEGLVIDKDSTGTVWAVWMKGFRPWVSHTLADDRTWSAPVVLPTASSDVTGDDICSLLHFGGDRIGVMWSDQASQTYWFSLHHDGDPATDWSLETVISGPMRADDHINLKAASDGRVFAALKSLEEIHLAVRATDGTWTDHLVTDSSLEWTRAIVLLDEEARSVHCLATCPKSSGDIYEKVSSMDAISFTNGLGAVVMRDVSAPESHNDVTSTRQNLSGETGLVAVASHQRDQRYWHHHDALGGPHVAPPRAAFAADSRQGYGPLAVQFVDGSTGLPGSWSWDFGDGQSSTETHPEHVYSSPGVYTVSLTVTNAMGSDLLVLTDLIEVEPAPTFLVLQALEDSQVRQASPDTNYGGEPTMRVRQQLSSDFHAYAEFLVPSTGNDITSATLRLFATDGSTDGGTVYPVSSSWNEAFLTWNNAPPLQGAPLGSLGNVATNSWVQLDVLPVVDAPGLHSFGLQNASTNSVFYSTREGVQPPELVLTLAPPALPPVADFEVDQSRGFAPLTVQFQDASSGVPFEWLWTFGDGGTSTLQNPSHAYAHAGIYSVTLQVTNQNGSDDETRQDLVRVLPRASSNPHAPDAAGQVLLPVISGRNAGPRMSLASLARLRSLLERARSALSRSSD